MSAGVIVLSLPVFLGSGRENKQIKSRYLGKKHEEAACLQCTYSRPQAKICLSDCGC